VSRYDNNNNVRLSSRKSPQHKSIHSLFDELVYLPEIVVNENFSLEILLIEQEDVWINDGKGSWRRKYWRIADRILLSVLERMVFYQPHDYRALLPAGLSTNFTSLDLSEMIGVPRHLAMKMLNCLRKMQQVEIVGKESRTYLYSISER
jgi:hypothetical protein